MNSLEKTGLPSRVASGSLLSIFGSAVQHKKYFGMSTFISLICILAINSSYRNAIAEEIIGTRSGSGPMSQITLDELQDWVGIYWEWRDTGVYPDWASGFEFTYPEEIPENYALFAAARQLFGTIYQHRLQPDPRLPNYFILSDLFDEDPLIFNAYKNYTISGRLKTPFTADPDATMNHLILAVAGLQNSPSLGVYAQTTFVGVEEGDLLSDSSLVAVDTAELVGNMRVILPSVPVPTLTNPTSPMCLRDCIDNSYLGNPCVLACLFTSEGGFFDNNPMTPGFDCDDFTDALIAWLLHHLRGMYPDAEGYALYYEYWNCDGVVVGHVVVYFKIGNYYFLIEPRTGELLGPFPVETDPDPRPLMRPCGTPNPDGVPWLEYDPSHPIEWQLVPPNKRPNNTEPPPWHTNPDMVQKLIDCIFSCTGTIPNPDDYIWDPDNPGTPCTHDCGCDPAIWVEI